MRSWCDQADDGYDSSERVMMFIAPTRAGLTHASTVYCEVMIVGKCGIMISSSTPCRRHPRARTPSARGKGSAAGGRRRRGGGGGVA